MLKEVAKKSLLKHGEVFVKGVIADIYDPALTEAKEELKKIIKGPVDDGVIELIVGGLSPILKEQLLKGADKLSEEV
jgi:hypothetical protein